MKDEQERKCHSSRSLCPCNTAGPSVVVVTKVAVEVGVDGESKVGERKCSDFLVPNTRFIALNRMIEMTQV